MQLQRLPALDVESLRYLCGYLFRTLKQHRECMQPAKGYAQINALLHFRAKHERFALHPLEYLIRCPTHQYFVKRALDTPDLAEVNPHRKFQLLSPPNFQLIVPTVLQAASQ